MNNRFFLLIFVILFVIKQVNCQYNPTTAKYYCYLADAAYCSNASIVAWNCKPCQLTGVSMTNIQTICNSAMNVFGFTAYDGEIIQVVFRGTEFSSIQNWINNLNFAKLGEYPKVPNALVHAGFFDDYTALSPNVLSQVKQLRSKYPNAPIKVTGHSLGAALAVLCAMDLYFNNLTPSEVFTYGEPRVGNQVFAQAYDQYIGAGNAWRVTHWRDIVPHLPLVDLGFYHSTREVWYNEAFSTYTVCSPTNGEDPTCSDSLDIDLSVADHLNYFNCSMGC